MARFRGTVKHRPKTRSSFSDACGKRRVVACHACPTFGGEKTFKSVIEICAAEARDETLEPPLIYDAPMFSSWACRSESAKASTIKDVLASGSHLI